MILALRYGDLSATVSEANRLANEIDQYCNDLSNKVQAKMYAVTGGMSSALNNADYYVKAKINQLRTKSANARMLSTKTQELLDTAKRVDKDVKHTIKANQNNFFQKNPELCPPKTRLVLTSFWCDMKNVPLLGDLLKLGEDAVSAISDLVKDIRYWWECGGGQELVMNCLDMLLKIGLAVAAVITAVTAVTALLAATVITAGAVIYAVAACVAAVIATANAVANAGYSVKAIQESYAGNPAMAQIYGKRDTLAQHLRETNFKDKFLNRLSNFGAAAIEFTEALAGVVLIIHSIGKTINSILSKNGVSFAFKELARGKDGKLTKKVTLKSIWRGTKALILNEKLTTSTSAGLRTTLLTNISQSAKYQLALLKYALKDPGRWFRTKQVGDLGFFRNIAEKIRYNLTLFKTTKPLKKVETVVEVTNNVLEKIQKTLQPDKEDKKKGLLRRYSEKIVQDTLFDNDYAKLINKTGIGGLISNLDKSGNIKDISGCGNGLIGKIKDVKKSWQEAYSSFKSLYPYFECSPAGGGSP